MAAITMTYSLAMAVGQDAANMRMRKAGRSAWNLADRNHAAETSARVSFLADLIPAAVYTELTGKPAPTMEGR